MVISTQRMWLLYVITIANCIHFLYFFLRLSLTLHFDPQIQNSTCFVELSSAVHQTVILLVLLVNKYFVNNAEVNAHSKPDKMNGSKAFLLSLVNKQKRTTECSLEMVLHQYHHTDVIGLLKRWLCVCIRERERVRVSLSVCVFNRVNERVQWA